MFIRQEKDRLAYEIEHEMQGKITDEIEIYLISDTGMLAILRHTILYKIGMKTEKLENSSTLKWILSDQTVLQMLLMSGDVTEGDWATVVLNLVSIIECDSDIMRQKADRPQCTKKTSDPRSEWKLRLAVATALTFATVVQTRAEYDTPVINFVERYKSFVIWAQQGLLFDLFFELSVWQMRYVVGAWVTDDELAWARLNVLPEYKTPDKIADVTHKMVKYTLNNADGTSVQDGKEFYHNKQVTLAVLHEYGGVCGAISKFAVAMAQAHGIPAQPLGQPGHCAYTWYKGGKKWVLGNDVSSWEKSFTHAGIQYTWSKDALFILLMNNIQTSCLAEYRSSEIRRLAASFVDEKTRVKLLVNGLGMCPLNYSLWMDLFCLIRNDSTDSLYQIVAKDLSVSSNKKYVNLGLRRPVSVSEYGERAKNCVENTGSEWWTDRQTGWVCVDLDGGCFVNHIKIHWWGYSKARKIDVIAFNGTGKQELVRTNDDEEMLDDNSCNPWSKIPGWNTKTYKVKLELSDGAIDPWGLGHWIGLRQIQIYGIKEQDYILLSTKSKDKLERRTETDGQWSSLKVPLDGICEISGVELGWETNPYSKQSVQIEYRLGEDVVFCTNDTDNLPGVLVDDVVLHVSSNEQTRVTSFQLYGKAYDKDNILQLKLDQLLGYNSCNEFLKLKLLSWLK